MRKNSRTCLASVDSKVSKMMQEVYVERRTTKQETIRNVVTSRVPRDLGDFGEICTVLIDSLQTRSENFMLLLPVYHGAHYYGKQTIFLNSKIQLNSNIQFQYSFFPQGGKKRKTLPSLIIFLVLVS